MGSTKKNDKRSSAARRLNKPNYKTFRLSKRLDHGKPPLPKARVLLVASIRHLLAHKKVFAGILAIYTSLSILLVRGFGISTNLNLLREEFTTVFNGISGQLITSIALFGYLIGNSSSNENNDAQLYQLIILIIFSLALIWSLRQTHADKKIGVREAFYKGMYPLIPFMVVLLIIGLQFIPLAIASWLFNVTILSGLAVTGIEQLLWSILCFLLSLLSIYMVSSSLFALYVSTLPEMTPLKALRSTRELVRYRRWEIVRKVLFLPVILLFMGIVIMTPFLLFVPPIAEWIFFILTLAAVIVSHSYYYGLYRELL